MVDHKHCEHLPFATDFPCSTLSKTDFRAVKPDQTFGNDKDVTGKHYKPAFAMAEGAITKILAIPLSVIESAIHVIATTGENKDKFDFFSQY